MSKRSRDILVSGFALFAIFFGAGNLIFPPLLGNLSGTSWWSATAGFLATDPILPILGVIATALVGGRAEDLGKRVSPNFAIILASICILLIGPILAVPRTAATTFEVAIQPYIAESSHQMGLIITSAVFFIVTFYFSIKEGKVIDIIGKFLTPALLVALLAIIIKGAITPIGPIVDTGLENTFHLGFTEGYQTNDALGAALMCGIVLTGLIYSGYTDEKEQRYMLIRTGIVAGVLLAIIYGGLTFLGAQTSATPATDRVALLLHIVREIFGGAGGVILGICVTLACLTTAVGLTSTAGNFFSKVSDGKLPYKWVVIAVVVASFLMSLLSVQGIINLAIPILLTIYPVVIVLILITLFDKWIKTDWTYILPVFTALIAGFIESMYLTQGILEGAFGALEKLPFTKQGFPWATPVLIALILGTIIGYATKSRWREEA